MVFLRWRFNKPFLEAFVQRWLKKMKLVFDEIKENEL